MPETSQECVVVLLDETSFSVPVKSTLLGSDLLDMAASHMKVKERDYFSLYSEGEGYKNWLDMDKPVLDPSQDLPKGSEPVKIYFAFKYFIHNLRYFNDFMTVELLYLQSRQAIFKGEILTDEETVFELAALVMQAQHGDYEFDDYAKQQLSHLSVLPVSIFNSKSIHYCEDRVMSYYRMINNVSQGEAVFKYLDIIQSLPMYSIHFFEVKDKKGMPLWLGVGPNGIYECLNYDKNEQTKRFQWLQLQNIYYKDKKFSMEVYNARSLLEPVSVHAWYGNSSKVIIAIWKMARDQHMFYRSKRTNRAPQAGMNLIEIIRQLNKHHHANISPSSSHSSLSMDSAKSSRQQVSAEMIAATKLAQMEMYQALLCRRSALIIEFEKKAARYKEILIKEMQITGIPPDGLTPEEIERINFGVRFKFSKFILDKGLREEEDEVESLEKEVEINRSILRANKTLLDQTSNWKLKKDRKKGIKSMEEKLQKLEDKVEELKKNKQSGTFSAGSKYQMDSATSSVLTIPDSVPVNRRRSGTPGIASIDDNFLMSMIFDTPTKPTSHTTYTDEYDLSPQGSLVSGSGSIFSPPNSSRRSDHRHGPREFNLTDDFLQHFSSAQGHPQQPPQHQHYTPENHTHMTGVRSEASFTEYGFDGAASGVQVESGNLPVIPREGYICAARSSICIVQLPNNRATRGTVVIDSVDDLSLHPRLLAKEFILTPVVRVTSDIGVFRPNEQAIIELLKTTELNVSQNNITIPIFSNTLPTQPPHWKDLNPDDFEVLNDRIVFNTTHFSLFTVIARLPSPSRSVMVTNSTPHQNPIELTLFEVSNLKVVIPPSNIKFVQSETKFEITAYFDHPSLCEESVDATACITLEPHGLQFKEKIPIMIPIPDYAQITKMYNEAKLQFLYSNTTLGGTSISWSIVPESDYKIEKQGNQYVGIVYTTHFSDWKAKWLHIPKPKQLIKAGLGPVQSFRKKLMKTFSGRCQVFMSSEVVINNRLNFSITALLHPLQEDHETPKSYDYLLHDSEKIPITVRGSSLKLTVELADYCHSDKKFLEEVELSGDFCARAEFNIDSIDSTITLVDGAVLGKLLIKHGGKKTHRMNLKKPKKSPVMKQKLSDNLIKKQSLDEDATIIDPEADIVIVYLPSLESEIKLETKDIGVVLDHTWSARCKWKRIGIALGIAVATIEVIRDDNRRTDDCFWKMLAEWLRNGDPMPCWKSLATALRKSDIKVLQIPSKSKPSSSPGASVDVNMEQSESQVCPCKKKSPVPTPKKRVPVKLPRKLTPVSPPNTLAKRAITVAVHQLNTSLKQWESSVVTETAMKISNCTNKMAVYVRDDYQNIHKYREDFAALAGIIVCESKKLIAIGEEVAEVCTKETLKNALVHESLPKIEVITQQFKLLMKVMESFHEEQGDAILVDNAENLLAAIKMVVDNIQVAAIQIKDQSVCEKLGLNTVPLMSHKVPSTNPQKPHPSQYEDHFGQMRSNTLWYDDNSGIEAMSGNADTQAGEHPLRMSGGSHMTGGSGGWQRKNQPPVPAPPNTQTQGITQQSEEDYDLLEMLKIWDSTSNSPFGEGTLI